MEAIKTEERASGTPVAESIQAQMRKHALLVRMRAHVLRILLLFMASYGLLYYSYKFERPWPGSNDYYSNYYFMYLSPLDLHAAPAPFVCRQISAVLTHLVLRSHIYFRNKIAIPGKYDPHVLFAAMLTNWVFLILAAWLAGLIAEEEIGEKNAVAALTAGFLCLLAFQAQFFVIAGGTEGVSWFLLAAGFFAYLRRARLPLLLILVLSIFQRETVIFALGVIAALDLILTGKEKRFRLQVCVGAVICFAAYFVARRLFIPGYDDQTHLTAMISSLRHLRLSRTLLSQAILTQNTMALFLAVAWLGRREAVFNHVWVPILLGTIIAIDFMGLAVGIEDNLGRVVAILVPILAGLAAAGFWRQRHRFQ